MWLGICYLLGLAAIITNCNVVLGSIKCYDCNYDPALLDVTDDDWAGKSGRGFPRCALQHNDEWGLVADTACQGTCFIRKDSNGLVYRGCADSWNLPYYVEVKNCTGSEGTVWWFCTGSHCNRATFGSDDVCPGSYDDQDDKSSDESSKSYGDDNQVYTRIDEDEGHDGIFDDIRYGGAYDELLYTYDSSDDTPAVAPGDGFDPYRILESGWQDYRNDLEPKSARDDDAYQEPVVPSAGVENQHRYGTEEAYTYDPPLPVNFYPSAPALVNPLFEEHYRSLVPDPRAHTQNSFQPPVAPNIPTKKSSDHEKAKSWQPKSVNTPDAYHKSWEGDDFSVSYNTRTGQNSEHVKSAYAYTDHSKSGYVQPGKSVKSHQPVKSGYIDMSADNGQTRNGYQPPKSMKSHVPVKSHPQKSMKSTPPSKSGYIPSPLKSVKSEPYVKSAGPHYKSVPVPLPLPVPPPSKEYEPSKSYQPSKKSHQPPPKSYEPPTKSQPPKKSYQPPPKSYEPKKYHIPAPKSLEAPSKSYMPPQKSYKPPKKSHIPPPKSYEPPKKSHIPPPKSYEPPTKSHIPPPKSYESPKKSYIPPPKSYEPPKKSYIPPPKSYEPPKKSHIPPSKSYEAPKKSHIPPPKSYELPQKSHTVTKNVVVDAPSLPIRHVPLLPLQPLLPLAGPVHDVILPDYKSSDFGDFWYEHYYRGDKMHEPEYDIPTGVSNPCDGDCSRNPSGLYPHPIRTDWFIQCGAGLDDQGYCSCCKPNYLRCPAGTTFDITTRVCGIIVESEYGASYKPIY